MSKTKLSVFFIMVSTIFSKILGLVREVFIASKYGTSVISDSFVISLSIPNVLFASLASAILVNYISVFSKIRTEEEQKKFNGSLINLTLIIITVIIIIFFIFKNYILKIFAIGYSSSDLNYLSEIASISIFSTYFILIGYILKGFLEYKEKFFSTAINGIVLNLGIIFGVFISSVNNCYLLGVGILLGYGINFLILSIFSRVNKFKYSFSLDLKNKNIKKIVILTLPLILNDAVFEINGVIDKTLASVFGEGYISSLNYSNYIASMVITVFVTSLSTVMFSKIVKRVDDEEYINSKMKSIFNYLFVICLPIIALLNIFSYDIIKVLFYRGAFDFSSLQITSTALKVYSFGIIFVAIKTVMFKIFYAHQDTKSPSLSAIIAIVLNIILSILLGNIFGYIGIILATIISSMFSCVILNVYYNKKYKKIFDKEYFKTIFKIVLFTLMFIILVMLFKLFINQYIKYYYLKLALYIFTSCISFLIYMFILKKSKINYGVD